MKQVEYFRWYMPNRNPRGKPYLSRFHMNAEEAAKAGALRTEPTSIEIRRHPENPEEAAALRAESDTSRTGAMRAQRLRDEQDDH